MLLIGKNVEAWFKVGQHKWSTGEDNQRKQTEWLDWGEFDCRDADAVCSTTQRTRPANSKTTAWLWDTGQSVSLRSIIHDTATCRRLMSDKMDQFSSLTEISQTDWSVIKSSRRRPNWKPVWPWRDTRSLSITVSRSSGSSTPVISRLCYWCFDVTGTATLSQISMLHHRIALVARHSTLCLIL